MEQRELSVYELTVAKGGPKMAPSAGDPNGIPSENDNGNGVEVTMHAENMKMGELAVVLDFFMNRPVVDKTGLTGRYDFQLKWTTDESKAPVDGSAPPTIFTAVQEQLGLKLEAVRTATDVMVIDKVERPGAN
ncbi:MAG TPA: TIGR03435 family protein [Acidobacteriaceae bacterium]|nr:TIGR03435 family protein [Acidobacteriaceae bacterium]